MAQLTAKKIVSYFSILLLLIAIVGYGIWRSRDILFGITLSVTGITDGMNTTEPILKFGGLARHVKSISVDGRIVPASENGDWTDTISLLPGYNIITIVATDKFNRIKSDEYRVYYTSPKVSSPSTSPIAPPVSPIPPISQPTPSAVQ